jgi:hypothetical protein
MFEWLQELRYASHLFGLQQIRREHAKSRGLLIFGLASDLLAGDGTMQKLIWRVKLVADFADAAATESEMARIEREDWAVPETLDLTLTEGKQTSGGISDDAKTRQERSGHDGQGAHH